MIYKDYVRYKDYTTIASKLAPIANKMEEYDIHVLNMMRIKDDEYELHITTKNFQDFAESVGCKITVEERPSPIYDTEISFVYDGCRFFAILSKGEEDYNGNSLREQ